jgi:hypothetical protein
MSWISFLEPPLVEKLVGGHGKYICMEYGEAKREKFRKTG